MEKPLACVGLQPEYDPDVRQIPLETKEQFT